MNHSSHFNSLLSISLRILQKKIKNVVDELKPGSARFRSGFSNALNNLQSLFPDLFPSGNLLSRPIKFLNTESKAMILLVPTNQKTPILTNIFKKLHLNWHRSRSLNPEYYTPDEGFLWRKYHIVYSRMASKLNAGVYVGLIYMQNKTNALGIMNSYFLINLLLYDFYMFLFQLFSS